MSEEIKYDRRRFLGVAAMSIAAAEFGRIAAADGQSSKTKPAGTTTIKPAKNISLGALKQIDAGVLNVGYAEAGPAGGRPVILLLGCQAAGKLPLPPKAELEWWYQYYFATERGRAGYDKYRRDFAKLIWQLASPKWKFDDATFERSAMSFDNPDHVGIVIHNYRWRLGLVEGEAKYDDLEKRLAEAPVITVPTITLEGDANGAPHPDASSYAMKFSGKYQHRLIKGGIGHNLPQEAPQAFAKAVVDVDRY